jgi:hypothetical protein
LQPYLGCMNMLFHTLARTLTSTSTSSIVYHYQVQTIGRSIQATRDSLSQGGSPKSLSRRQKLSSYLVQTETNIQASSSQKLGISALDRRRNRHLNPPSLTKPPHNLPTQPSRLSLPTPPIPITSLNQHDAVINQLLLVLHVVNHVPHTLQLPRRCICHESILL